MSPFTRLARWFKPSVPTPVPVPHTHQAAIHNPDGTAGTQTYGEPHEVAGSEQFIDEPPDVTLIRRIFGNEES